MIERGEPASTLNATIGRGQGGAVGAAVACNEQSDDRHSDGKHGDYFV